MDLDMMTIATFVGVMILLGIKITDKVDGYMAARMIRRSIEERQKKVDEDVDEDE